jgi:hypothetical protein
MDESSTNEGTLCLTVKQWAWVTIGNRVKVSWYRCNRTGGVRLRVRAPLEMRIGRESTPPIDSTTRETTHEHDASKR